MNLINYWEIALKNKTAFVMKRRLFLTSSAAAGLAPLSFGTPLNDSNKEKVAGSPEEVVVERFQSGQPHQGKVLAAIQPHVDDIPIFAGGTVAKLIREGCGVVG